MLKLYCAICNVQIGLTPFPITLSEHVRLMHEIELTKKER